MASRRLGLSAVVSIALTLPSLVGAEPLVIIVSSSWQAPDAIELADLRAVYLGRRTRLFGRRVQRVDLPSGSPARAGFSRSVLGRSEPDLERYWIEQALSGGALPPRQLPGSREVIEAVRDRDGLIGYLPESALRGHGDPGVRALAVRSAAGETHSGDPAYPVRTMERGAPRP